RLDDGARRVELPLQHYPHIDHGYALTTHKAQGVTVDHAFVLADGKLADREIGLVQLSRHRESAHLFVDRSFYEAGRVEHGPNRSPPPTRMAETPEPESRATLVPPCPPTTLLVDRLREAMAGLAAQLQVSRQKDTTQDYSPRPQSSQGQGLE
ncbi:MAG: hypothetical protein P9E88_19435, partial [Candidatus Competibacter sp.]|nr:hypothetical protein [Candidatus Competibacter sp.]